MNTEVELKFLVTGERLAYLPEQLSQLEVIEHDQKTLTNTYFDTPNLYLSQLKAGLRIRGQEGQLEQTLKLAGSQVGGLHLRPEYNVNIAHNQPDLSLFPDEVWPDNFNPAPLQAKLAPLFATDFVRERWLVSYQNTQLELALDVGEVRADKAQPQQIQELELELVSGEVSDLFALAQQLVELGGLRLSAVSKAQRGYRLAALAPAAQPQPFPTQSSPASAQAQTWRDCLRQGLAHWQYHEQGLLDSPAQSTLDLNPGATQQSWLTELQNGVQLVTQALTAIPPARTDSQQPAWLAELTWLQSQLLTLPAAYTALEEGRYGRLVLQLTHYLYNQTRS